MTISQVANRIFTNLCGAYHRTDGLREWYEQSLWFVMEIEDKEKESQNNKEN